MSSICQYVVNSSLVLLDSSSNNKIRFRPKDALPSCYRKLPASIKKAIYLVWEVAQAMNLTRSMVSVMQAILAAGVSIDNPSSLVFAKKKTLARMAKCSEITVYRALRKFEEMDWIERMQQVRLEDGCLDISQIRLSIKAIELLELVSVKSIEEITNTQEEEESKRSSNKKTQPPSLKKIDQESREREAKVIKMKDGLIGGSLDGEQGVDQKPSVHNQSGRFVWTEGRAVAQELLWLITERKLSFAQLFKLQTLAKAVPGQRLTDYVALRRQRLSQLNSQNDCFRYLRKLILEKLDARFLCNQQKRLEEALTKKKALDRARQHREAWARAHHDRVLTDRTNELRYKVNAVHGLLEVSSEGSTWIRTEKISDRFIRAVGEGRVVMHNHEHPAIDREKGRAHLEKLRETFPWLRRPKNEGVSLT
jgi:hypothetical protein